MTVEEFFRNAIQAAPEAYKAYEELKKAEKEGKKTEAKAEAERMPTTATTEPAKVLGIPVSYVVAGGVGLALVAILLAVKQ